MNFRTMRVSTFAIILFVVVTTSWHFLCLPSSVAFQLEWKRNYLHQLATGTQLPLLLLSTPLPAYTDLAWVGNSPLYYYEYGIALWVTCANFVYLEFFVQLWMILYMKGPRLYGGWGFWEGQDMFHQCAMATDVTSAHWARSESNANECILFVLRKFDSFFVGVCAMLISLASVYSVWWAYYSHFVLTPMHQSQQQLLECVELMFAHKKVPLSS